DMNKLLVPTQPVRNGDGDIISGINNDVGVTMGIIQSFYDAPGQVSTLEDGTVVVDKGSRFMEEMREINISAGLEYWYNKQFAARFGYFHEHSTKGNRKFFTAGAGLKLSVFSIDFSYLFSTVARNPLANTIRFTLRFDFDDFKSQNESTTN
ncbi:MAG: PorV/PorQ family protein, partial [Flavobacteriales bacterium]|nr:PorV/PorQ family protein [Flavobacteriales bacterium]